MITLSNFWSILAIWLQISKSSEIFLPVVLSYGQLAATSMPPRHHGCLLAAHWPRHLVGLGRDSGPTDMLAVAASTDIFYMTITIGNAMLPLGLTSIS